MDEILRGGIPYGSTVLASGTCGSGKTTLCMEFLVRGATAGEACAHFTATEPSVKLLENIRQFSFFDMNMIDSGLINVFDMDVLYSWLGLEKSSFDLDDVHALIKAMAEPDIRIVSLTITEGGYYQDPATGKLDITHRDILYDVKHPDRPRTAFGAMVAALRLRRDRGIAPFTGLSCDNLQGNGTILRQAIIGLAELGDVELARWIDSHCSFPNSMVDCIVPATGPAELALVQKLGIDDSAPVTHEDFRQWVIEDNFCAGRPDWDKAGAEFSRYVHQHETQKIRILNGGHQILANAAEIMGLHTISQAMRHPLIGAMFAKVQQEEILPHITPPPGQNVSDYLGLISTRFANEAIVDTVRRVAFDGAARHVGFILPSLRDGLTQNSSVTGLALIEAIWARMCLGMREDGSVIEANDPSWEMLVQTARQARTAPRCWLEMGHIYGDLKKEERFASAFEEALSGLYQNGIEQTITAYLASSSSA